MPDTITWGSFDPPDDIREHFMAVASLYCAERQLREMVLLGPAYAVWLGSENRSTREITINVAYWEWGDPSQPINRGLLS